MLMTEQERTVAHHVVDDLVAVDVPLSAASGTFDVKREGRLVANIVGDTVGEESQCALVEALRAAVCLYITIKDGHSPLAGQRHRDVRAS